MRHPETARAAVATLFVLAAALPAGRCTAVNSKTDSFATLAEARQAGAIAGGWVPDGLPPGSREIRAAHVPGTSARWGIVNFPPAEADALRAILMAAEVPLDRDARDDQRRAPRRDRDSRLPLAQGKPDLRGELESGPRVLLV